MQSAKGGGGTEMEETVEGNNGGINTGEQVPNVHYSNCSLPNGQHIEMVGPIIEPTWYNNPLGDMAIEPAVTIILGHIGIPNIGNLIIEPTTIGTYQNAQYRESITHAYPYHAPRLWNTSKWELEKRTRTPLTYSRSPNSRNILGPLHNGQIYQRGGPIPTRNKYSPPKER